MGYKEKYEEYKNYFKNKTDIELTIELSEKMLVFEKHNWPQLEYASLDNGNIKKVIYAMKIKTEIVEHWKDVSETLVKNYVQEKLNHLYQEYKNKPISELKDYLLYIYINYCNDIDFLFYNMDYTRFQILFFCNEFLNINC